MKRKTAPRRRPSVHITLARAARLYRLVVILGKGPRTREILLSELSVGLRTFYRELELLKKCGIKIRLDGKTYALKTTSEEAEGRLPFPDPQLSFAEMSEITKGTGEAARRLAELYAQVVVAPPETGAAKKRTRKKTP